MREKNRMIPLRQTAGCPSDNTLDLFCLGELPEQDRTCLSRHLADCMVCQERLESRELPNLGTDDHMAAVDELHRKLGSSEDPPWMDMVLRQSSRRSSGFKRRRWTAMAVATVSAAVLALILFGPWSQPDSLENDVVRIKGGAKLVVYRERAGEVKLIANGEHLLSGDRLRFVVDVPHAGELMLIGVEADGTTYPCYPTDHRWRSIKTAGGSDLSLPGSVRLDDSLGREWIHFVWCPTPFKLGQLKIERQTGKIRTPAPCMVDSFRLFKSRK